MRALLDQFAAHGVTIEPAGDGKVRAIGNLTDATRALIRAHKPEILAELAAANDPTADVDVLRRRSKALAILAEHPARRIAVVAEAGDPVQVCVALRDGPVGEIEIAADKYDAFALLALMQTHGHA